MNNIIIKANNKEEYNKTLDILSGLEIVWSNGQIIDSKNDDNNSYDVISDIYEFYKAYYKEEDAKEDKLVVCLIVEHNKLFWELLDSLIDNCFNDKDYEMYSFKEFEKVYNI